MFKNGKALKRIKNSVEVREKKKNIDVEKYIDSLLSSVDEAKPGIVGLVKGIIRVATNISTFYVKLVHISSNLEDKSKKVKDAASEMLSAIEQTNASMGQIAETVTEYAASTTDIAHQATALLDIAECNSRAVQEADAVNKQVSEHSLSMENDMDSLMTVLDKMKNTIDGINQIAEQTNMLALNASIEAARAGENGKGFAVVAGEVRKLSETTKNQLSAMTELMSAIQKASEKSKESVVQTRAAIEEMNRFIDEVASSVNKSKSAIQAVTYSVQQIAAGSEEINATVQQMTATVNYITEDASKLSVLGEDIRSNAEEVERLSEEMGAIEGEVSALSKLGGKIGNDRLGKISNQDFCTAVDNAINAHSKWVDTLESIAREMNIKAIQTDGTRCGFGHFYNSIKPTYPEIKALWEQIDSVHLALHKSAHKVIDLVKADRQSEALSSAAESRKMSKEIIAILEQIKAQTMELNNQGISVL